MTDSHYSYDESTEVWPYFVLTLLGSIVLPATLIRALSTEQKHKKIHDHEPVYNSTHQEKYVSATKKSSRWRKSTLFLIFGWICMGALAYIIYDTQVNAEPESRFDPYALLGVTESTTVSDIKSVYRKLSLQFHPDKFKETAEMTLEMAQSKFIELTKAYKSLTDEVTRENYLKYGHPDGPQQSTHGIALPSFLIGSGSTLLMAVYALVVGGVLPYLVGRWWAQQKVRTRAGILFSTAAEFFEILAKEMTYFIGQDQILEALLRSEEMRAAVPDKSPEEIRELLEAHFERRSVPDEHAKLEVATKAALLLRGFFSIAAEFKSVIMLQRIQLLHRCVVQAVPPRLARAGGILQIPGSDLDMISAPPERVKKYRAVIPRLHVLRAEFKIPGDIVVTPKSQPFLEIKYVIGPLDEPAPKVDLEDLDQLPVAEYTNVRELTNPMYVNTTPPPLPAALTPYYPVNLQPTWEVMLAGERDLKLVHAPVTLSHADLSNLSLTPAQRRDGDGVVVGTFKIQLALPAPPFAGMFAFRLYTTNACYFGVDTSTRVVMVVAPESSLPPPLEDEDIPETEPDQSDDEEEEGLSDLDTDTEDEEEKEVAADEDKAPK